MRTANKPAAFQLAQQLHRDLDHDLDQGQGGETETPLDDTTLDRYWTEFRCDALPEPLDAIWLQCAIALPSEAAVRLLQSAAYIPASGNLDDATMEAVEKMRSVGIEEWLLDCQAGYYIGLAVREMCGMDLQAHMRRIEMCRTFLVDWIEAQHRFAPLHSVK